MNCEELKYYQYEYLSGSLSAEQSNQLADHLIDCKDCRKEIAETRLLREEINSVRKTIQPQTDLWAGIEKRITRSELKNNVSKIFGFFDSSGSNEELKISKSNKGRFLIAAGALSILIAGFMIGYFYYNQSDPVFWAVQRIEGSPKIGKENIKDFGMLKVGEWLETDSKSRARINVGTIGEVDVDRQSKIKLIKTKPSEHRILLMEGKIHAAIWAPPKLFFVETPSATAIDLGCMYSLEVTKEGSGFLKVTSGWVAFDHNGIESIIPEGAACETRENVGPGIPYFEDASVQFITSLTDYDFEKRTEKNLEIILNNSRKKDLLSLWHLLAKADNNEKEKIFYKMKDLTAIPDGVTLSGIKNNNKEMMNIWWEDLGYGSKSLWNNLDINN